jgi:hypothetical protein
MTFCVLGENCSVFDKHTKTSGITRNNPLCEGCRNRARRELDLLRFDYVDLSQLIPKRNGYSEAKISRPKPESSPTIDVSIFTLRSQVAELARAAEESVRIRLGMLHSSSVMVREGFALTSAIAFLYPRVDELALTPAVPAGWDDDLEDLDGPQVLYTFGVLHRRARRVCGIDPKTVAVPGLCPSCSVPGLRRHDDDPLRYWCTVCNVQVSQQDYFAAQRMQFAPVTRCAEPR